MAMLDRGVQVPVNRAHARLIAHIGHRHHRHRSTDSSYSSDRDRKRERCHRRSRNYDDEDLAEYQELKGAVNSSKCSSHRYRDDDKGRESGRRRHRFQRHRSREPDGDHRRSRRSRSLLLRLTNFRSSMALPKSTVLRPASLRRIGTKPKRRKRYLQRARDARERKMTIIIGSETAPKQIIRRLRRVETIQEGRNVYIEKMKRPLVLESRKPKKKDNNKVGTTDPKTKVDPHTFEREARNLERMQKEMQRRSTMDGKGSGPNRKMSGAGVGQGGRRVSYKCEDEESSEARASRGENEREAGRQV